jgi:hypothetical protein
MKLLYNLIQAFLCIITTALYNIKFLVTPSAGSGRRAFIMLTSIYLENESYKHVKVVTRLLPTVSNTQVFV